jgi:hypothetical protein
VLGILPPVEHPRKQPTRSMVTVDVTRHHVRAQNEWRSTGETHDQALRVLSNRLVGILDGCLRSRSPYDEAKAWGHRQAANQPTAA